MAKKRVRSKPDQPSAEIEVIGAIDIYSNGEPVPESDAAELRRMQTREQIKSHLEQFIFEKIELVPQRIVDFRDGKTGKVHRATVYALSFVRFEDVDEGDAVSFDG